MFKINIFWRFRDEKLIIDRKDNSSQTEHCYLVRNSQSCQLRKKQLTPHLYLHFDHTTKNKKLQKLPFEKMFSNLNLSIHRKASDNLIYEKKKGSASPGYVPTPERFRWKFLTPSNITENNKLHCKQKWTAKLPM